MMNKKALKSLNKSNNKFKVSVLQGVTGSGKQLFILKE